MNNTKKQSTLLLGGTCNPPTPPLVHLLHSLLCFDYGNLLLIIMKNFMQFYLCYENLHPI